MSDFDILNELAKITDMNSMLDFVIVGAFVAMVGFIFFNMSRKTVPGILGMMAPALAGAILGAMLYIFNKGTHGG